MIGWPPRDGRKLIAMFLLSGGGMALRRAVAVAKSVTSALLGQFSRLNYLRFILRSSNIERNPINRDAGIPNSPALIEVNAVMPSSVITLHPSVFHVSAAVGGAQIRKPVIKPIPIDMVDMERVFSGCHFPSKPVGVKFVGADRATSVTIFENCAKFLACVFRVPRRRDPFGRMGPANERVWPTLAPKDFASFRVVIEKLEQLALLWERAGSHSVSPYVRGQGRAVLVAPLRPAFPSKISIISQGFCI